jgi:hypothetical protein
MTRYLIGPGLHDVSEALMLRVLYRIGAGPRASLQTSLFQVEEEILLHSRGESER